MLVRDTDTTNELDITLAVCHFVSTYGWQAFDNGNISWAMFWVFYNRLSNVLAFERVNNTKAVSVGAGLVMGGKEILKEVERDRKEAFGV